MAQGPAKGNPALESGGNLATIASLAQQQTVLIDLAKTTNILLSACLVQLTSIAGTNADPPDVPLG